MLTLARDLHHALTVWATDRALDLAEWCARRWLAPALSLADELEQAEQEARRLDGAAREWLAIQHTDELIDQLAHAPLDAVPADGSGLNTMVVCWRDEAQAGEPLDQPGDFW